MPLFFKSITIFLLISILYSCSTQPTNRLVQYSATNGAGLKLDKKNDIKFSVNSMKPASVDSNDTYIDFQIGYSPIKYLGLQAEHYRFNTIIRDRESSQLRLTNLSSGAYCPIDMTNVIELLPYYPRLFPDSLLLEFYGGVSLGKAVNQDSHRNTPEDFHVADFRMRNYFFRGGWRYYLWRFSFNSNYKWGTLNVHKGVYDYARGSTSVFSSFNRIKEDNDATYAEATHQLSYNGKEIQIHIGMSSLKVNDPSNIRFKDTVWYGGLTFDIQAILNHNKNYNAQR